ncbi:hypothetical protein [Salinivibrio socompensis]|nr:hypothetical protein [Salinivibrio socompensis]
MKAQIEAMSHHLEQLATQAADVDRRRGEAMRLYLPPPSFTARANYSLPV